MKKWTPYLLVSPYILHFSVFVAFPVVFSIVLTFHNWNIIAPMKYVGLANYEHLFKDRLFWQAVWNTVRFLIVHIPLQIGVAILLAELLNRTIRGLSFFRAAFFLPVIVSGVVVTILWQQLLSFNSGILNRMLIALSLPRIPWLIDPDVAMYSIAVMATWKNVGLYVILFLVGLQSVPTQYYEAADLEGATDWQKFRYITLPIINPTIFTVVVLSTIGGFSLFVEPYIMTEGGPMNKTLSAVMYIYRQAFQYYHMGYSATLGFCFALIILFVVVIQRRYVEQEIE
ncbi:carbohydrate ABC transporter permease [Spirosoma validum]|uniref:Sugar ABC transporter permease n=1 Tax=Spirosoma validum TaxID=2771355 RepID=A0A927GH31_9BACT|nr:sugar ABC transporter permease [Spirosoma validum]MBD2757511.1 sugar ABC transporter permease [Spirosoma validum]